ncbi:MAG: hypothetical protein HYU66_23900 [Armatimonadetes bacterium]|nr:hypothetical protein [Armatimonadota bacterium]
MHEAQQLDILASEEFERNMVDALGVRVRPALAQARRERMGLRTLIDEMRGEIEGSMQALGLELRTPIFVGEFPTGSFNAMAYPVSGGVLALMSTGLFMFIYKFIKIMALSIAVAQFDERGRPIGGTETEDSGYGHDEIVRLTLALVRTYLRWRSTDRATYLAPSGGRKWALCERLVYECEKFVLAHEYGHAVSGHLEARPVVKARTDTGDLDVVQTDWQHEVEADVLGTILLLEPCRVVDSREKALDLNVRVAAPLFFFGMDDLVSRCEVALWRRVGAPPPVRLSHPPSADRARLVRQLIRDRIQGSSERAFGLADLFLNWLSKTSDTAVERIGAGA